MITIHGGHNKPGKIACGASDFLDESKEARILSKKILKLLKKYKIKAKNITVNNGTSQLDILKKLVLKANKLNRDMDISIHFNSYNHTLADGKTMGVECLIHPAAKSNIITLAKKICNNIAAVGFKNRGIKFRDNLYFINKTNKPALIIEVCFVSDEDDAALYLKNKNKVAKAIASAINSFYS